MGKMLLMQGKCVMQLRRVKTPLSDQIAWVSATEHGISTVTAMAKFGVRVGRSGLVANVTLTCGVNAPKICMTSDSLAPQQYYRSSSWFLLL
jgi:hypothetical protein